MKLRLLSSFIILTLLLVLAGCSNGSTESEQKTVRIGIQQLLGPLWIAKEKGWFEEAFKEQGIEVEWVEFQSGPPQFEGLAANKLDFTEVGNTPVISGQAANVAFKEIAVTYDLVNALLIPKDSDIKSVEDLKGKKIAVAKGSSAFGLLYQVLESANISPDDIEIIQLQPDEARPAFENGSVDAWSVWDPFVSIQVIENDAQILVSGKDIDKQSPVFALARQGIIDEHPEYVDTFLEVYARAAEWRSENEAEVVNTFVELRNLKPEVVQNVLDQTSWFAEPITNEYIKGQQEVADLLAELKVINQEIDTSKVVDNQFVDKLQKENDQ